MSKDERLVDEIVEEVEELVEKAEWPPRSRKAGRITLGIAAVFALALFATWTQREPIARSFVKDALDDRGVQGRYEIKGIGFRKQRIENLVIGDPKNPDLTAEWAEVITRIGLGGPKVSGIRAHGVRLRGRLVDGRFSFGHVDKLLPEPTGEPFALPDLNVELSDARLRLDLPAGAIGAKLEGRGNLSGGFRGKLAAVAPALVVGDCALTGATAWLDLVIAEKRPKVAGPVRAIGFGCKGQDLALERPQAVVDAGLNDALDQWQGSAGVDVDVARMGTNRLSGVIGTIGFEGRRASTRGDIKIAAESLAAAGIAGQGVSLKGGYEIGARPEGVGAEFQGRAELDRTALDRPTLARIARFGVSAEGTPIGPVARALSDAMLRAGRDTTLRADFTVSHLAGAGSLRVASLSAASPSGARVSLSGGQGVRLGWPGTGAPLVDGRLTLSGGGFPGAVIQLSQGEPGAPITGIATLAPYQAGKARLALAPVRFTAAGSATRFETTMTLDGPLGDGRVTGLALPLDGRIAAGGGLVLNQRCAPLSFTSLEIAGLELGRNRMTLCPSSGRALFALSPSGGVSGGARVAAPRLSGRLGTSPVSIAAAGAEIGFARGGFSASDLALRLGLSDSVTRLDVARLSGVFRDGGIAGNFQGTGGQIANVPLIVSESAGDWSLKGGILTLKGGLQLTDADAAQPRFNRLSSNDFALTIKDGRITASGLLHEPGSKAGVAQVEIVHNLGAGTGNAVLDVTGLQFGGALKPDTLTRLALGVVDNVRGTVTGQGNIRWSPQGVTSDGVFRTENSDFAAAFGPVTAATGELRFTDLLGLVSAPGQRIWLGVVNPGIAVVNGYIDYQLLPDQKVRIEGGRWPFAGGELILEPAVLDLGVEKERRLTFRVVGLDAAQFINQFELKDINVTGIFDGVIPMVFDSTGGRIEGGRLVVRESGGTLAYVGQVSNENLGTFGSMAFDALKSIKYSRLALELNGPLDGEMVTQVRFTGTNQGTVEVAQSSLTSQFIGLPFLFNITIKAPFRGLLNTARSFTDPSLLIRQHVPGFEAADQPPPVQPKESEKMQ